MSAKFDCSLKPSELNNAVRQFMSDIFVQTQEIKTQTYIHTKTVIVLPGTVCYADRDFLDDDMVSPYWQLADGTEAKGELKSLWNWQNVPNLISTFLEVAQTQDWARYSSNNKKHRHYFELSGETNRQTSTQLWRGSVPKARQHHSDTTLSRSINYYGRDFEVVNPHSHRVIVQSEGADEFRPDHVCFIPFICHTAMR